MSRFPNPINISVETQTPEKNGFVYDMTFLKGNDYIYDIELHSHPLLVDRSDFQEHYRMSNTDVDYVQLLVDNNVIDTISNNNRVDPIPFIGKMPPVYTQTIDFFKGDPILSSLLTGDITLRFVFWREPVTPFWVTYKKADSSQLCWGMPSVQTSGGHTLNYRWGILR